MTKWKIYNEDAVEWAKNYQKGKFHALLCDAPYHLTSIVKRFGKAKMSDNTKTSERVRDRVDSYSRLINAGFMGQQWDGGDIAFRPETWEAFKEVLYPGAFGMAFSASRNWHRMAIAIEDAGFIIHPTMFFLWVQGQGFPKATNISKQLEKSTMNPDDIEAWKGHRYGLQALKPAVEPIIVFQSPYEGKPLDNIVSTGAGALNIDDGRIPLASDDEYTINTFDDGAKPFGNGAGHKYTSRKIKEDKRLGGNGTWKTDKAAKNVYEGGYEGIEVSSSPLGRWPANLILDEGSAEKLDLQTGTLISGKPSGKKHAANNIYGQYKNEDADVKGFGDVGGASRFFYQVSTQLDEADPFYYCAKVSPKERNAGLDEVKEKITDDGRNKPIDNPFLRGETMRKNNHPTVKPIDLCKYLATLLLPPAEYSPRRIFIPFSGSGSEMIAAGLAGWEHIVGVEFDTENGYVDIAERRLEHWLK